MYLFSHTVYLYSSNVPPLESLLFKSQTQETISWKHSREGWMDRCVDGERYGKKKKAGADTLI